MHSLFPNGLRCLIVIGLMVAWPCCLLRAESQSMLFIGNSLTYAGGDDFQVQRFGGVPKMLEVIAAAKGKTISTTIAIAGGKDLGFHLTNPPTDKALKSKLWDWVVLQDYIRQGAHVIDPEDFFKNGEAFYDRITAASPNAKVILYETWAYKDEAVILQEIQENFAKLQAALAAKDPQRHIIVAEVGTAFMKCLQQYPEIPLHPQGGHANKEGYYLSALVFYATIFQDSPKGAVREFTGFAIDADVAAKLQTVAEEVVLKK